MSRITRISDMTFFLDNFDVNFLHCLCVNRFVSSIITTIIIFMSGSVSHLILLLL